MFQIKINRTVKLNEVDELYKQLYQHIKLDVPVNILLPTKLESGYLGIVPTLYQFVFTWMRYPRSGKLLIDIKDPSQLDLDELYENELIFPLVSMVWNTNEVFNYNGKINLRPILKEKNVQYFNQMKAVLPQKNRKLLLTHFDHLPEERGILPCFELKGKFVANEANLSDNLIDAFHGILALSLTAKRTLGHVIDPVLGIIYELMKNTFEWASANEAGVPLDPNVRGLLVKFYNKTRKKLLDEFQYHKGLTDYFSSPILDENSTAGIYLLEIDVFDSGIGFARKYKSLNPSGLMSDVDIIKKCMIKHNTSARGLEKDNKGIGLDRILTLLNGKGFLRIKTGQNCIYRNLISTPYKKLTKDSIVEMELLDWKNNSNKAYTIYPEAEGAVITIIYPLSYTLTNE